MDRCGGDGRHHDVLCADAAVIDARNEPDEGREPDGDFDARAAPDEGRELDEVSDLISVALVPVVGFWSTTTGISRAELDAMLMGASRLYRRVLVAGTVPGATPSSPDAIRTAVNADTRTLGLLPAGEVTPDVRALTLDGLDLFGNDRLRDVTDWPLHVPAAPGVDPPAFDPATTWTLVAGGDVMLDRSVYRRTVRQGKGGDYPWDGGLAEIIGRRCCSAAGHPLPVVRRTGQVGAVRALFQDADLALVNLEGPAINGFRWHPHGLTFTFDPAPWRACETPGSTS